MFAYIKGTTSFVNNEFAVVEAGGIGYKIFMPFSESAAMTIGAETKVYTYMYIREGILDVYGFTSKESLRIFEMLIGISGVGPKAAIAILNVMSPSEFITALETGDAKAITRAQGIGTKIAQRVILELKGKLDLSASAETVRAPKNEAYEEAAAALVSLGYSPGDADKALAGVTPGDTESMIKQALKNLF